MPEKNLKKLGKKTMPQNLSMFRCELVDLAILGKIDALVIVTYSSYLNKKSLRPIEQFYLISLLKLLPHIIQTPNEDARQMYSI